MWLVLGRSGFLGTALCRLLNRHGIAFVAPSSNECDIRNPDHIRKWVQKTTPEVMINCVALTNVDFCEEHPDLARDLNAMAPARLAAVCQEKGVFFAHFSTDYVFSGSKRAPYVETDLTDPLSVYGWSKRLAEEAIQAIFPEKSLIIRTAWLFSKDRKGFFVYLSRLTTQTPEKMCFPRQTGSPTYLDDLAVTTLNLIEKRRAGLYHVVNGESATWKEMAEFFFSHYPGKCPVISESAGRDTRPARRPSYSVLETRKLREKAGIIMRPWQEAADECLTKMLGRCGE